MSTIKDFKPRIYCGKGREFSKDGINIAMCISDIPEEHIRQDPGTGRKWVSLTLYRLKEPKEKQTHSLQVDTYKPKDKK